MVAMTDNHVAGRAPTPPTLAELNDAFRQGHAAGQMLITDGVVSMGGKLLHETLRVVREYDVFDIDNDPHGEHDFGAVTVGGELVFWKIDYYDADLRGGSPNPSDTDLTTRVLTIMLAPEY